MTLAVPGPVAVIGTMMVERPPAAAIVTFWIFAVASAVIGPSIETPSV